MNTDTLTFKINGSYFECTYDFEEFYSRLKWFADHKSYITVDMTGILMWSTDNPNHLFLTDDIWTSERVPFVQFGYTNAIEHVMPNICSIDDIESLRKIFYELVFLSEVEAGL